jgi:integrase
MVPKVHRQRSQTMSAQSAAERLAARIHAGQAKRQKPTTPATSATLRHNRLRLTESVVAGLEKHLPGIDLSKRHEVWDAVLPGLVLRRAPSGAKSWSLRTTVAGRRSRITLGTWPALGVLAAREAARAHMGSIVTGTDPVAVKRAAARRVKQEQAERLGEFIEGRYADWAAQHLRSHEDTLDALSVDFGAGGKRKKGAGWWNKPLSKITVNDVEQWRIRQMGAGLKPTTINRSWQRLRAVMGKAQEWGLLQVVPPRVKRLKTDRGRVRFLTPDERARLMDALEAREQQRREQRSRMIEWQRARHLPELPQHGTYTDHLRPLVLLALNTGLRRGELLKLQWRSIDFALWQLHVTAESAKAGRSRVLPLNKQARETLTALREQCAPKPDEPKPDDYVFGGFDGTAMARVDTSWRGVMKAAGVEGFRFHDLRHSFASDLVQKGIPLFSVSQLLGHGDLAMTQIYAHLGATHLADAVAALDGIG